MLKFIESERQNWKKFATLGGKEHNLSNLKLQNSKLRHPDFFALVEKIQDLYYDTSIHPAGIVIAEQTLNGLVPLKTEKNYLLTLFEENNFRQLGLKKYDFLSLKETLSFIRETRNFSWKKLTWLSRSKIGRRKNLRIIE